MNLVEDMKIGIASVGFGSVLRFLVSSNSCCHSFTRESVMDYVSYVLLLLCWHSLRMSQIFVQFSPEFVFLAIQ